MINKKYEIQCDLCKKSEDLKALTAPQANSEALEKGWYVDKVAICQVCRSKISG